MTAVTQLTHHGMIFVPPGYASGPSMFGLEAPKVTTPVVVTSAALHAEVHERCSLAAGDATRSSPLDTSRNHPATRM